MLLAEGTDYYKIAHPRYKYCVQREVSVDTGWRGHNIRCRYYSLSPMGIMRVKAGYCWDGASAIAIDTDTFMRASLFHDVAYQMLREGDFTGGVLPTKKEHAEMRRRADRLMYRICRIDGMHWLRAAWCYIGVRFGGNSSTLPRYY